MTWRTGVDAILLAIPRTALKRHPDRVRIDQQARRSRALCHRARQSSALCSRATHSWPASDDRQRHAAELEHQRASGRRRRSTHRAHRAAGDRSRARARSPPRALHRRRRSSRARSRRTPTARTVRPAPTCDQHRRRRHAGHQRQGDEAGDEDQGDLVRDGHREQVAEAANAIIAGNIADRLLDQRRRSRASGWAESSAPAGLSCERAQSFGYC